MGGEALGSRPDVDDAVSQMIFLAPVVVVVVRIVVALGCVYAWGGRVAGLWVLS